jgi:hypothetical protein
VIDKWIRCFHLGLIKRKDVSFGIDREKRGFYLGLIKRKEHSFISD